MVFGSGVPTRLIGLGAVEFKTAQVSDPVRLQHPSISQ